MPPTTRTRRNNASKTASEATVPARRRTQPTRSTLSETKQSRTRAPSPPPPESVSSSAPQEDEGEDSNPAGTLPVFALDDLILLLETAIDALPYHYHPNASVWREEHFWAVVANEYNQVDSEKEKPYASAATCRGRMERLVDGRFQFRPFVGDDEEDAVATRARLRKCVARYVRLKDFLNREGQQKADSDKQIVSRLDEICASQNSCKDLLNKLKYQQDNIVEKMDRARDRQNIAQAILDGLEESQKNCEESLERFEEQQETVDQNVDEVLQTLETYINTTGWPALEFVAEAIPDLLDHVAAILTLLRPAEFEGAWSDEMYDVAENAFISEGHLAKVLEHLLRSNTLLKGRKRSYNANVQLLHYYDVKTCDRIVALKERFRELQLDYLNTP